jgi:hypothetical protein
MKAILLNKLTIVLFCMAILTYFLYSWYDSKITPPGSSVTEKQLLHDMKIITNDELRIDRTMIVLNGQFPDLQISSKDGTIDKDARILIMNTKIRSISNNYSNPYNVQEAMRIWLYLNKRILPYKVEGVAVSTRRSGGFDKMWEIIVEKKEFKEMYDSIKDQKLNDEQMIAKLSDMWITKYNYQGWWNKK